MVSLPFAAHAARLWRRLLTADLVAEGLDTTTVDSALLVASELAGNAVLHGRPLPDGSLRCGWDLTRDRLLIELVDGGSRSGTAPHSREPSEDRPTGRGLALVEALVSDWGYEVGGDDGREVTRVWAVLPLTGISAEPGALAV